MNDNMVWVARRDGTGWNSNRLRGDVNLAFTVSRNNSTNDCMVEVRRPYSDGDNTRARWVVGRLYFVDHQSAKYAIGMLVKEMNSKTFADQAEARDWFLQGLFDMALRQGMIDGSVLSSNITTSSGNFSKGIGPVSSLVMDVIMDEKEAEAKSEAENTTEEMIENIDSMNETSKEVFSATTTESTPATISIGGKEVSLSWPK